MEKTIQQLESELKEKKREEFEKERKERTAREDKFKKENKIDICIASDYCGMVVGGYDFYYGYEITECPVKSHKDDEDCYEKDCDKREWCFVASINGKKVMRKVASELWIGDDGLEFYLLAGIGQFLKSLPATNL